MILDAVNDHACLGQLTEMARELASTTLVQTVARRLGSKAAVVRWLQSLPQTDDLGQEAVRFIACDVPQRVRLFADDPNCVERALAALLLLEALDPKTSRALATVDKPARHTGLVEQVSPGRWRAVDLFPRRNGASDVGKDILQGLHTYVGKPVLKFYLGDTGGKVADQIGSAEDRAIGRGKSPPSSKDSPSPATRVQPPSGGDGGTNGKEEARTSSPEGQGRAPGAARVDGEPEGRERVSQSARDVADASRTGAEVAATAKRWWWERGEGEHA